MKKRTISITFGILMSFLLMATPVFASDANVEVNLSDITITGDNEQGGTATASGTITVTASASDTRGNPKSASASVEGGAEVNSPSGANVDLVQDTDADSETNYGWWWWPAQNANAEASITLPWEITFYLNESGTYTIMQYGSGIGNYLGLLNPVVNYDSKTAKYYVRERPQPVVYPEWWPSANQFVLLLNGVHYYDFENAKAKVLPVIELVDTLMWNGQTYKVRVSIPADTILDGENVVRVIWKDGKPLLVAYSGGKIAFSNPIVVEEIK